MEGRSGLQGSAEKELLQSLTLLPKGCSFRKLPFLQSPATTREVPDLDEELSVQVVNTYQMASLQGKGQLYWAVLS